MLTNQMQVFSESVVNECKKFYAPASQSKSASDAAINVVCLRAIKFKQQHGFGIFGAIKLIKMIRNQLKKLNYTGSFRNELSIFLVKTLLSKSKETRS